MNKKLEVSLAVAAAVLVVVAVGQLVAGNWIESAALAILAFATAVHGITTRRLRRGYQQQLASMQFKYGDLVKTTDFGYRGMVISDRPATGWVSVVLFKNGGEQAAVYSPFDLEKTS